MQKALDGLIWSGQKTVVLVAHRLSTVVGADQIVVIEKGKAVEQGKHSELLEREGKYADLVRTQLQAQAEVQNVPVGAPPSATAAASDRDRR